LDRDGTRPGHRGRGGAPAGAVGRTPLRRRDDGAALERVRAPGGGAGVPPSGGGRRALPAGRTLGAGGAGEGAEAGAGRGGDDRGALVSGERGAPRGDGRAVLPALR